MKDLDCDQELNLSGLHCPLPVLKTRQALQHLQRGSVLKVLCTDPLSLKDFPLFCQQTQTHLLRQESKGSQYYFWLEKA